MSRKMSTKADQQLEGLFNDVREYTPLGREDEFRLAWTLKEQRDRILYYLSRFPPFFEHLRELRQHLDQRTITIQELFHLKSSTSRREDNGERDVNVQLERFLSVVEQLRSDDAFWTINPSFFPDRKWDGTVDSAETRPAFDLPFNVLDSLSFTQEYLNNYVDNLIEHDVVRFSDTYLDGKEYDSTTVLFHNLKQSRALYEEAATILILSNLRLVVRIAKRFAGNRLLLGDMVQEGILGLMKAVDRFNVARGNRFSTYAMWWIRQSVHRSMLYHDRIIRLPVHLCERIRRMRHLIDDIQQQLGQELSDQEVVEQLSLENDDIFVWMNMIQTPRPIEPSSDDMDETYQPFQVVADERTSDPLHRLTNERLREEIHGMLETLTSREQRVIQLRFGIAADRRYTLEEVGLQLGVTRERIRQIETRALNKLRHPLRATRLETFLS